MLSQLEDAAAVKTDALEDAVAIEEAVVKDGHLGFGLGNKLAIEVNQERRTGHEGRVGCRIGL